MHAGDQCAIRDEWRPSVRRFNHDSYMSYMADEGETSKIGEPSLMPAMTLQRSSTRPRPMLRVNSAKAEGVEIEMA